MQYTLEGDPSLYQTAPGQPRGPRFIDLGRTSQFEDRVVGGGGGVGRVVGDSVVVGDVFVEDAPPSL